MYLSEKIRPLLNLTSGHTVSNQKERIIRDVVVVEEIRAMIVPFLGLFCPFLTDRLVPLLTKSKINLKGK